ncbi:MAG: PTS IIA-like nitrogen-regulatory protein PtsN [Rickettsiales bacterium]|nr:PTS IIA-like nitrogen-regulatory protein PtsN [Rickettsiales bacterium]
MNIAELLTRDSILLHVPAGSQRQALQQIAAHASQMTEIRERTLLDGLVERERLGSTAVGDGVAIPHARFAGLNKVYGFFIRLQEGVEFDAPDDKKVDLIFALLAPESANAEHLKVLARISRILRDENNCSLLRQQDSKDQIFELLTSEDQ